MSLPPLHPNASAQTRAIYDEAVAAGERGDEFAKRHLAGERLSDTELAQWEALCAKVRRLGKELLASVGLNGCDGSEARQ